MLINNDNVSTLVRLGFSPNQAKVYIALVGLGTCTAKKVWKVSGVSREETYRKLNELQKLGFIERVFANPFRFKAVPLEFTITKLLKCKAEEISNLQIETDELIKDFAEKRKNEDIEAEKPEIVLIPEQRPLLEKAREELENVKNSLDTICPWRKGLDWLSSHHDLFMNALNRDVKIRFVIEKTAKDKNPRFLEGFQNHPKFQLKTVKALPPACMGLYDQKRLIMDTSARGLFIATPCLWSNNPSIVGMAQIYFEAVYTS